MLFKTHTHTDAHTHAHTRTALSCSLRLLPGMRSGFHLQSQQLELWHLAQHLCHKDGTCRSCWLATCCTGAPQALTAALGREGGSEAPVLLAHQSWAPCWCAREEAWWLGHHATAHFDHGLCLLLLQQIWNDSLVRGSEQGSLGDSCPVPHCLQRVGRVVHPLKAIGLSNWWLCWRDTAEIFQQITQNKKYKWQWTSPLRTSQEIEEESLCYFIWGVLGRRIVGLCWKPMRVSWSCLFC